MEPFVYPDGISHDYGSPRWSGEILDCSMPLTFDTYSICSYNCAYCFAAFQKAVGNGKEGYLRGNVRCVNVDRVKRIFTLQQKKCQFAEYLRRGYTIQWGGMSDPFCEYERRFGISLELLKMFHERQQQICFSTKGAWWTEDSRYMDLFTGASFFNMKISIITLDKKKASVVEAGCPTPLERLKAMERFANANPEGGVTLRLRPFIFGVSSDDYKDLIRSAADAGATALSTEFLCMENRATEEVKRRYARMSKAAGYDILEYYRKYTPVASGYMRLNREAKREYVDEMEAVCKEVGMRFYVSDAHFKERCHNGSCCGLDKKWDYSRHQCTEALCIAKEKGKVYFRDVMENAEPVYDFKWGHAQNFNCGTNQRRARFNQFSMYDYIRLMWNDVNSKNSPYNYFGGILVPDGTDDEGNVIYRYNKEAE